MQHFLVKRQGVFPGRFLFYFQGQKKSRDFREQYGDLLRSTIRQNLTALRTIFSLGLLSRRAQRFALFDDEGDQHLARRLLRTFGPMNLFRGDEEDLARGQRHSRHALPV